VYQALKAIVEKNPDPTRQLRALWALHATKGLTASDLQNLLSSQNEYVRSWAIQFLAENKTVSSETLARLEAIAQNDPSPVVRLYLTSAMMRLPLEQRWHVLTALSQKTEDKADHNLPLMLWYAAEPLATADPQKALQWAEKSVFERHLAFMVRRVKAINTPEAAKALSDLRSKLAHSHAHPSAHDVLMLIDEGDGK
jgi:HEAT repeats